MLYSNEKRNKLINKLLSSDLVATQERFMSTSVVKSNILRKLIVPAGSPTLYAEVPNLSYNNHHMEMENRYIKVK